MGKILIANVGNRTLVMKGINGTKEEYDTKKKGKDSFKEATKADWEEILKDESYLELLDSNIIDAIINAEDSIDRIYLFTSDQAGKDENLTRKDTLYAGEILCKLLKKKYSQLSFVENIILSGVKAINLDELTSSFREKLLDIVENKHKGEKFIICDSGGTPQQKNALKIVAEYFLNKDDVTFYQVYEEDEDENGVIGKSYAEEQKFYQIRKIADAQSMCILIERGEYAAAAYIGQKTQKDIEKLLWLMHYRVLLMTEDAKTQILGINAFKNWERQNPYFKKEFPSIQNYLKQEPTGDHSKWNLEFTKDNFFRLCEILELGRFYYFKNDWSNVVLTYHVFLETFVAFLNIFYHCSTEDKVTLRIRCLDQLNISQGSKDFLNDFKKLNKHFTGHTSLNNLRNQIAHDGKGVKREEIVNIIPDFFTMVESWYSRFGVPVDKNKNAFILANKELQEKMKRT